MFEMLSRVRFSESDYKKRLKWLSLLDYFQDCSVAHSESLNVGCDYLADNGIAWLLISWNIYIDKFPLLCDQIHVQTWPYEMKGFYGKRNFQMLDDEGNRLAYADTTWVMVDTSTGRPAKIPEDLVAAYEYDERIDMEKGSRKLAIPADFEEKTPIEVPVHFLDTNKHMNNGRYLEVAIGYLPEDFEPKNLKIEYRKEAKLHDILCPRVTVEANTVTVVLADQSGSPYCVLRFEQ